MRIDAIYIKKGKIMFKRPHTAEEKRNLSEKMKAYYRSLTKEEREERNNKHRETIKQKEDIIKFFYDNLHTINDAVMRERKKKNNNNDIELLSRP